MSGKHPRRRRGRKKKRHLMPTPATPLPLAAAPLPSPQTISARFHAIRQLQQTRAPSHG